MQWGAIRRPLALILALAVARGAAAALLRPSGASLRHAVSLSSQKEANVADKATPVNAEEFADSETVEGPDCGHVKQIIGKWRRAGVVGKAAGEAEAALSKANLASSHANDAADRAEEIASSVAPNGEVPVGVASAAKHARDAAENASSIAVQLEIELGSFKAAVDSAHFGDGVDDPMLEALEALSYKAFAAARVADEAAAGANLKADEVSGKLKGDAVATLRAINGLLGPGEEALATSAETAQKAGWAVDAATILLNEADDILGKLKDAADAAEEQKPVWEAEHDALQGRADGFEQAQKNFSTAIQDYRSAADTLSVALEPLAEASKSGAGGDTGAVIEAADKIGPADTALMKFEEAESALEAALAILTARRQSLQQLLDASKAKLNS